MAIFKGDRTLVFKKEKLEEYKEQILKTKKVIKFYEQGIILGHFGILGWELSKWEKGPKGHWEVETKAINRDWDKFKEKIMQIKDIEEIV